MNKDDFVLISAGKFNMGSLLNDSGRFKNEGPFHRVRIKSFYISKYLVTQSQWCEVMDTNPSYFKGDDLPIESVSWKDVQEFIHRLNELESTDKYCLPTEAEWEYSCRADSTTKFYFGDDVKKLSEYAWYECNSIGKTHPVGQKKPNAWGLYDMHGNVCELVQDKWHDNYNDAPTDGSVWETEIGHAVVLRGGSWFSESRICRSARRCYFLPDDRFYDLGFRLAIDEDRAKQVKQIKQVKQVKCEKQVELVKHRGAYIEI